METSYEFVYVGNGEIEFINKDMEVTIREITEYIRQDMSGTKKQG